MLCWTSCPSFPAEVMPHPVTILHTHCHCRLFLRKWIPFPIKSATDDEPESSSSGIPTSKGWENSVGCRKALPQRALLEWFLLGTASWILLIHQQQQDTNGSVFPSLPFPVLNGTWLLQGAVQHYALEDHNAPLLFFLCPSPHNLMHRLSR